MTSIKFALDNFTVENYQDIFTKKIPLLDVRSPNEFNKGAFANSINIPILDDEQRAKVGTQYKLKGKNSAIDLGFNLVSEAEKQARFYAWKKWFDENPQGFIYCFRGGLRSKLTQDFLYKEYGLKIPRIYGGYKALRRFMLDFLQQKSTNLQIFLLGGKTGSGKTTLLNQVTKSFDLEKAADHLGSAFGNRFSKQPSQINFEHKLGEFLINYQFDQILLEDESRHIGRCEIPAPIFMKFQQAQILVLEVGLEERVKNIFAEYVIKAREDLIKEYGEEKGLNIYASERLKSLTNIQSKLGLERFKQMQELLTQALAELPKNRMALMQEFIQKLLVEYYDPMYNWQLEKKQARIIFKGNKAEIQQFAQEKFS